MKQTLFQLFSLRGIAFLWSALLSISSFGNAEPLAGGNISIAPSEPNGEWNPSRELYPGESVALQVEIASSGTDSGSEGASGGTYTLTTTKVSLERGQSLWTKTAGEDGGTSFTFEIANSGDTPARHKVGVSATWTLQGGDGDGGSAKTISGFADGSAYTDLPVFSWSYQSKVELADGNSPIVFTATAEAGGANINLAGYSVEGQAGWEIQSQAGTNTISGSVKSSKGSSGYLAISYKGKQIGKSEDEIAFEEVLGVRLTARQTDLPQEGNRQSNASLLLVSDSGYAARKAEIEAVLVKGEKFPEGYPKWEGDGLESSVGNGGATSVSWSGSAPRQYTITIKMNRLQSETIRISIAPHAKEEFNIPSKTFEQWSKTIDKMYEKLGSISDKEGGIKMEPLVFKGHVSCFKQMVDYYNNGSQFGDHLGVDLSLSVETVKVTMQSPLLRAPMHPYLTVRFSVSASPITITGEGKAEFNESIANPASGSVTVTGFGGVAIAVVGVAGYHAGETVIGIEAKGEIKASIGAEVKFSAEHDGIYSEGKGWIGDAIIPVKATFRLGNVADYEFYNEKFQLFDGIKSEPVRNKIYPKAS